MKNFRFVSLAAVALLLGSLAQAQVTHLKANVPFDFVIGNTVYSAGNYDIGRFSNHEKILRIDNVDESRSTVVTSDTCSSNIPARKSMLVFHRVGDTYFLYQIWVEGNTSGLSLPKSKMEIQLASNKPTSDSTVAATNLIH